MAKLVYRCNRRWPWLISFALDLMAKLVIGFCVGVCFTVVTMFVLSHFYPQLVYPQLAPDPYWLGHFHEDIDIAHKIPAALGADLDPNEPREPFLGGKMESVVIVTRNGVKTLRKCCDDSKANPTP